MAAGSAVSGVRREREDVAGALPRVEWAAVIVLCAAKLLLHVLTSVQRYGYFRDELYYLDLGRHLAFGYVDCAPLGGVCAGGADDGRVIGGAADFGGAGGDGTVS